MMRGCWLLFQMKSMYVSSFFSTATSSLFFIVTEKRVKDFWFHNYVSEHFLFSLLCVYCFRLSFFKWFLYMIKFSIIIIISSNTSVAGVLFLKYFSTLPLFFNQIIVLFKKSIPIQHIKAHIVPRTMKNKSFRSVQLFCLNDRQISKILQHCVFAKPIVF